MKKNQTVIFLDGDRSNFDPANLAAISRKELAVINHENLMTSGDAELSKTGVLIARLKIKVREKLRGTNDEDEKS